MTVNSALPSALLDSACSALQEEIDKFLVEEKKKLKEISELESMKSVLLITAEWLAQESGQKFSTSKQLAQEKVPDMASSLRDITQMWSIFLMAWQQNKEAKGRNWQAIAAGNRVARGLHRVTETEVLNLIVPHQVLVVVPSGAEGYSVGFGAPTPYIVSPYWGIGQVWTWLSYAHEVGHHIYRNVKGLRDELKVNVTLELWKQNVNRKSQQLWFNWLEEVFADLFGILRIGPEFAKTQQIMLQYLPQNKMWPNVNKYLLASDAAHPMPYLRSYLSVCTLEKIGKNASEVGTIEKGLIDLVGSDTPTELYALAPG